MQVGLLLLLLLALCCCRFGTSVENYADLQVAGRQAGSLRQQPLADKLRQAAAILRKFNLTPFGGILFAYAWPIQMHCYFVRNCAAKRLSVAEGESAEELPSVSLL